MMVLGVNADHPDSAACLMVDGALVAAAEEERFRRVKHWSGFPDQAVRYCLKAAGARLRDVDRVAVNSDPRSATWARLAHLAVGRPAPGAIVDRWRAARARAGVLERLGAVEPAEPLRAAVRRVEHHLAHLASVYLPSTLDEALVVSVDGFGDFTSAAWTFGQDGRLGPIERVRFPHSLGIFYQAMTQFLGFPHYGDEYKVMGLAAYGTPGCHPAVEQLVRADATGRFRLDLACFRHHDARLGHRLAAGAPAIDRLYAPELTRRLGPARHPDEPVTGRHRDLARAVQDTYERALLALVEGLHARRRVRAICLSGGCAMNSLANGKLRMQAGFDTVEVPASPGDAGGAVGAAWIVSNEASPRTGRVEMEHPYWGPEFDDDAIGRAIAAVGARLSSERCRCERLTEPGLLATVAGLLVAGAVVGWFQGRMEWGPRALGNRSILADPRRADMRERLNRKIKRRESFRPFAPSILREHVGAWFEIDDDVPYMSKVYRILPARRDRVPAVAHVDGTGRLHTVSVRANRRFHALIEAFRERTSVPMLLNTSFNENEPIVCDPEEALECFLRTGMDALVLGDRLIARPSAPGPAMPGEG